MSSVSSLEDPPKENDATAECLHPSSIDWKWNSPEKRQILYSTTDELTTQENEENSGKLRSTGTRFNFTKAFRALRNDMLTALLFASRIQGLVRDVTVRYPLGDGDRGGKAFDLVINSNDTVHLLGELSWLAEVILDEWWWVERRRLARNVTDTRWRFQWRCQLSNQFSGCAVKIANTTEISHRKFLAECLDPPLSIVKLLHP